MYYMYMKIHNYCFTLYFTFVKFAGVHSIV